MNETQKKIVRHFISQRAGSVASWFNPRWDATDMVEEAISHDLSLLALDDEMSQFSEVYKSTFISVANAHEAKLSNEIKKLIK